MIHTLGNPVRAQHRESTVKATLVSWSPLSHHWGNPGQRLSVAAVKMEKTGWNQKEVRR